jgi:predicted dehydrogenase
VVVDKPVAPTAAQARDLAALAADRGTVVVPFQNRRWDGDFLTVSQVATGLVPGVTLGALHRFESRYERWQPESSTDPRRAWKRSGVPGDAAGIIYDLGTHIVDQAIVLFGRPDTVYAERRALRPGAEVDDDVFVALGYGGGAAGGGLVPARLRAESGVGVHLWASALAADQGPRFRVLGSAGAYLKWGMDPQEAALLAGEVPGGDGWGAEPPSSWGVWRAGPETQAVPTEPGDYSAFYTALAACLLDGGPPPVDIADAVTVAEVIEAALRSAEGGSVVSM